MVAVFSGGFEMEDAPRCAHQPSKRSVLPSVWRASVICIALCASTGNLRSQCPDTGETKVIKPTQGSGYYFYRFLGDSSFRYFLDGKTFSFNEKDDPGRTFIFIDDFAYESNLTNRADLEKYVQSSEAVDVLRAQAKHEQEDFKRGVPSMVITDYGPSATKNADGSDGRLFYLWKKENAAGDKATTQYLVSTLIKGGVVVLSVMPLKASLTEDDVFLQIRTYTSRFDMLTSNQCARALSAPTSR
jgi:hypothetical protein